MKIEKSTKLNAHGVKDSANMWRTFNGAHYEHLECNPTPKVIAAYRAAGVRCRHVRNAARQIDDLFCHHEDRDLAHEVHDTMERP